MFEPKDRVRYEKNQIVNVVCQLRFPTILAISAREPAEFQEAVRGDYPVYQRRMERPAAAPGADKRSCRQLLCPAWPCQGPGGPAVENTPHRREGR